LNLGGQITKILDKGSIELFGPFGLEKGLVKISKNISYLSTSHVTTYALYILIGFIVYLAYYYLQFNLLLTLIIMFMSLIIGNGKSSVSDNPISREINYNNNKQLSKNSIYIYNNKMMFSTSAYFFNPNNSNNSSESAGGSNSENKNGLVPEDSVEAIEKKEKFEDTLSKRNNIGDNYTRLNKEHGQIQDAFSEENGLEESELSDTLINKADELRESDNDTARCHKDYKDLTGVDLPGAKD
jgi:NADH-ubiquinone oxidoreductase chain 5